MGDNLTKEYFLKLLDEASQVVSGDKLSETHEHYEYTIQSSSQSNVEVSEEISQCHKCTSCFNRRLYAEPILRKNPLILFILPSPDGDTILSPESFSYFSKWLKAINLTLDQVALTSLIKCPVVSFDNVSADSCREYLKNEMKIVSPKSIVLLGASSAQYMLRRNQEYDEIRLHTYKVNGIKTFTTYSPSDLVRDRSLRGKIWEDLKYISYILNQGDNA